MSANDYYAGGKPQGQYGPPQGQYYPPPGPMAQGYYPQQPQQTYQQGGPYQGPPQGPPQGYPQQPQLGPQTIYVQQQPEKGGGAASTGCMACLAGICLCCCAEELCECLF